MQKENELIIEVKFIHRYNDRLGRDAQIMGLEPIENGTNFTVGKQYYFRSKPAICSGFEITLRSNLPFAYPDKAICCFILTNDAI